MRFSWLLSLPLFLTSGCAVANTPTLPTCPDVDLVRLEGLSNLLYIELKPGDKKYFAYEQSSYDTERTWLFGIGHIDAESKDDAREKANALLQNISGTPTPTLVPTPTYSAWVCHYNTNGGYFAEAASIQQQPRHGVPPFTVLLGD